MTPPARPILVVFHCGAFFAVYGIFVISIGRRDVEAAFANIHPDYIRNMLVLMSLCFAGYIGLWNQRRWSLVLLPLCGAALLAFGIRMKSLGLPNFLPLLAGLTSLPLWPVFKKP